MPSTLAPREANLGLPAPPAVFSCSWIDRDPDATCVHAVGELDIASAPQLDLTLREAQSQARLVVLDLSELAFIDGAGVHAIVDATVRARHGGRRLVLLGGPTHVERLFDLTGAAEQLERGDAGPGQRIPAPSPGAQHTAVAPQHQPESDEEHRHASRPPGRRPQRSDVEELSV